MRLDKRCRFQSGRKGDVRASKRHHRGESTMQSRAKEREGLELVLMGLEAGLLKMPDGCVSALALAPLVADVQVRLATLAPPPRRGARTPATPRRPSL